MHIERKCLTFNRRDYYLKFYGWPQKDGRIDTIRLGFIFLNQIIEKFWSIPSEDFFTVNISKGGLPWFDLYDSCKKWAKEKNNDQRKKNPFIFYTSNENNLNSTSVQLA